MSTRTTYLLRARNHAGVKIGATYSPNMRRQQLSGSKPFGVCKRVDCAPLQGVVMEREYCEGVALEAILHAVFASRKIHGEWYDIEPAEADEVVAAWAPAHVALRRLGLEDRRLGFYGKATKAA